MYLVSEIDVVEGEIFEYNIFFVALHGVGLDLIITSFNETDIRKDADYTNNQQEDQNKYTDGIGNAQKF